jgi:hypothetical protein
MTWIKLDDSLPNNPKILPLSDGAFRLYIEGLCYANQYLTDGYLANAVLIRLDQGNNRDELVWAKLWIESEDGICINDYTEHQSSKADVEAKKEQVRDRVQRFRTKSNAVSNADVTLSETEYRNRIQNTDTEAFDRFWSVYPRKAGKQDAQRSFERALKVATLDEILAGAQKYADDPNRVAQFTAHPSTWLNQGRWSDDPLPRRTNEDARRGVISTPTIVPPRFTANEAPTGSPMPDFIKDMFRDLP